MGIFSSKDRKDKRALFSHVISIYYNELSNVNDIKNWKDIRLEFVRLI